MRSRRTGPCTTAPRLTRLATCFLECDEDRAESENWAEADDSPLDAAAMAELESAPRWVQIEFLRRVLRRAEAERRLETLIAVSSATNPLAEA